LGDTDCKVINKTTKNDNHSKNSFDMKYPKNHNGRNICLSFLLLGVFFTEVNAQTETKGKDTLSMVSVRAASGVDPINIKSRILFTSHINNPKGPAVNIMNNAGVLVGIRNWYIGFYGSAATVLSGIPGEGFKSGCGDFMITLQDRFYMHGKHGLAITGALVFPTGKRGFGSQYFSFTPVFTWLYEFNRSLIMVIQPQYSFHLVKDPAYPPLRLLSARAIVAKFTKTGYAFCLQVKPVINLQSDSFYCYVSPFVNRALGAGFNVLFLYDIPVNKTAANLGPAFEIGINRYF
jgi:hypothetical protein